MSSSQTIDLPGFFHRTNAVLDTITRYIDTSIECVDGKVEFVYEFDWGTKVTHSRRVKRSPTTDMWLVVNPNGNYAMLRDFEDALSEAYSGVLYESLKDKGRA